MRILIPAVLATACATSPPPDAGALTRLRAASGGDAWDRAPVIESHGQLSVGGLTGTVSTLEDLASGRRRESVQLGPTTQASGFDGEAEWQQLPGGEVLAPSTPAAIARARTSAWLTRRGYFRDRDARYRQLGIRVDGGVRYRVLEATPPGGTPVELWLDEASGLLARTVSQDGQTTTVSRFEDQRWVDGVRIPFRVVVDQGDPRDRVTTTLTSARRRDSVAADAWARPTTDSERLTFANGARRTELPFELINNHIYIRAAVDGKPVRMLVDTGGVNVLTPAAAKRLGLSAEGKMSAGGGGAAQVDMAFAHARTLAVGDVQLARPLFYVIALDPLTDAEGEDFDGLVGFEMFARLVVRIDYPGRRFTLSAPADFSAPPGAIAVPFALKGLIPVVHGAIDGLPAILSIDTGAANSITTTAPFTRRHQLVERYRPRFEAIAGWGLGGEVRSRPVRFDDVRLGDAAVRGVVGDLFLGDKGALADPEISANIGGRFLRRFVVTFNYGGHTMYLERSPAPETREPYDRSGLVVVRAGEALRVAGVISGSPAERAGVRPADRILAVDGAPVTSRRLADWRAHFRDGEVGARLRLTVERDGTRRDLALVLAELVP